MKKILMFYLKWVCGSMIAVILTMMLLALVFLAFGALRESVHMVKKQHVQYGLEAERR